MPSEEDDHKLMDFLQGGGHDHTRERRTLTGRGVMEFLQGDGLIATTTPVSGGHSLVFGGCSYMCFVLTEFYFAVREHRVVMMKEGKNFSDHTDVLIELC